jgi:2-polyprenyl-3-methyl-5-hydroxy-6-metoxy-1,4-benzoquinol methylase
MVLKVTKDFVKRHGVSDRYDYLQGNLREIDFGQNQYDLIILGHICHSEGAEWSRKLIAKCGKALKPGGTLAIPDMVPDENRTAPEFDVLFALNMLLHTNQGDTFTLEEYKKWLKAARLDKVQLLRSDKIGCDVVIARKPAK